MTEKLTVGERDFTIRPTKPEGGEWLLLDSAGEKVAEKFSRQEIVDFLSNYKPPEAAPKARVRPVKLKPEVAPVEA